MKARVTIDIDSSTGDYDLIFNNISSPGAPIDYTALTAVLRRIFSDVDKKADTAGEC